jgi:hypothetical protein
MGSSLTTNLPPRTTCKRASVSPINACSDTRKNRALLLLRQGATRHDKAELGSARRKHRFPYCCVIAGTCFEAQFLHGVNTPQYDSSPLWIPEILSLERIPVTWRLSRMPSVFHSLLWYNLYRILKDGARMTQLVYIYTLQIYNGAFDLARQRKSWSVQ